MTTNTDDKKIHKTDVAGNVGCVVLLILLIAWGIAIYNGVSNSLNRDVVVLRADVTYQDGIVTLTNKENMDWMYVWMSLDTDDDPETYEYSYYVSKIGARATIDIDLTLFTKDNILNFDPATMEPHNLSMYGRTQKGSTRFLYTWQ